MQKVSLILLLFVTFITAQSVYIEDRREITKENIIDSIRHHFFAQRCGGLVADIEDIELDIQFEDLTDCLENFLEVQRIMQELSAIKMPKTLISKYFVERFEPAAQYIERYIQKQKDLNPDLAERVTYQKELHKKYANVTITQKMITSLNKNITTLKNQQKYLRQKIINGLDNELDNAYKNDSSLEALISKMETLTNTLKSKVAEQKLDPVLQSQVNGSFDVGLPVFQIFPKIASLFTEEEKYEYVSLEREIASRKKDIRSRVEERYFLEKTSLETSLASLDKNLVLLREEIDFLKKQYEIQKVEKMSQAQLTQYVIEHSSCSKEELLETARRHSSFVCPYREEEIVADAKKGFYNTEALFFPFKISNSSLWTDDEPEEILHRARGLYNVAQAFKRNDIPALVKFLNSFTFSPITTQEEQVLIKETIEAIKTAYRIDDKKMEEFLYGISYIEID